MSAALMIWDPNIMWDLNVMSLLIQQPDLTQTKVGQLKMPMLINKQVVRFEITNKEDELFAIHINETRLTNE